MISIHLWTEIETETEIQEAENEEAHLGESLGSATWEARMMSAAVENLGIHT